jgi:hypothetical protein
MASIQIIGSNGAARESIKGLLSAGQGAHLRVGGMNIIHEHDTAFEDERNKNGVSFVLPDNIDPLTTLQEIATCFAADQGIPAFKHRHALDLQKQIAQMRIVTGDLGTPTLTSTALTGAQFKQLTDAVAQGALDEVDIGTLTALSDMRKVAGFKAELGRHTTSATNTKAPDLLPPL